MAKKRELTHYIEGSGEDKGAQLPSEREAALVPMLSTGKHGRLQEAVVKGSGA